MTTGYARTTNPTGTDTSIGSAPDHPDGGTWRWEMVAGNERIYSDDPAMLLDAIYPGYANMTENGKWTARYLIAVMAQVHVQAEINSRAVLDRLPRKQQIVLTGARHRTVMVPTWDCVVPLVLLRTDYAPATGVPVPFSHNGMPANIWWIDPSDDMTLLISLHDTGYISLHMSTNPS